MFQIQIPLAVRDKEKEMEEGFAHSSNVYQSREETKYCDDEDDMFDSSEVYPQKKLDSRRRGSSVSTVSTSDSINNANQNDHHPLSSTNGKVSQKPVPSYQSTDSVSSLGSGPSFPQLNNNISTVFESELKCADIKDQVNKEAGNILYC